MFFAYKKSPLPMIEPVKVPQGKKGSKFLSVYPIPAAFDIETTNDPETESAYMYHWQFSFGESVFAGRTWDDLFMFLSWLKQKAYYADGIIYVFIHNMDFEMSFLLPQIYVRGMLKRVFAKSEHAPLEIELTNGIIFRDSAALTNMSLANLAKNYTKTQKMTGDLDYSKMRNSTTLLDEKEKKYCINDVVILKEYAEQLHAEYTLNKRRIPLTSTGIVRQYIREQIAPNKRYIINKTIQSQFPESERDYQNTMRWLFRGGYTHAQTGACGQILKNVISYDLTSAYPSAMVMNLFPSSPFTKIVDNSVENVEYLINTGHAVIFTVTFEGIHATTPHCVESKNKIIDYVAPIFENGRLYEADSITVYLTDIDYRIYKMFYKWDRMIVHTARVAHKSRLPDYLYNSILEFYRGKKETKAKLKALEREEERLLAEKNNGHEVSTELRAIKSEIDATKKLLQKVKGMLNSCYGMCVSHLNFGEFKYGEYEDEDGESRVGWYEDDGQTYSKLISKQFLNPYWGIYCTALVRFEILSAIKHFGKYAIYSDTDSIKLLKDAPGIDDYFTEHNNKCREINEYMCQRLGLAPEIYSDMGTFDYEGAYTRFKTLGAKRYLYEKNGKIEAVIAGLPKTVTEEYAKKYGVRTMFNKFRRNMYFEFADKNAHKYTDECSATINGEIMHELGSCYIYETSFRMTIDQVFLDQIAERKDTFKHE